jgi:hypothetical protein
MVPCAGSIVGVIDIGFLILSHPAETAATAEYSRSLVAGNTGTRSAPDGFNGMLRRSEGATGSAFSGASLPRFRPGSDPGT